MKHLDLFSGIGGFAISAERVWPNIKHTFVDNDQFCQQVLKRHWPEAEIHGDIRSFTNSRSSELGGVSGIGKQEISKIGEVYLLTGGFPCQPFSQAGRRKGTADDRHLWPEMLRVIREFKPRWVIGENVGGFVTWSEGLVLEQVHADLEGEGYEVQAFIIPAVAVNAPHRRDRVWIVGHAKHNGQYGTENGKGCLTGSNNNTTRQNKVQQPTRPNRQGHYVANTARKSWNQNWFEVATRLCRVDDGIPRRMDRNPRLKALGNAIVPQVAEEIMEKIKEIDNLLTHL